MLHAPTALAAASAPHSLLTSRPRLLSASLSLSRSSPVPSARPGHALSSLSAFSFLPVALSCPRPLLSSPASALSANQSVRASSTAPDAPSSPELLSPLQRLRARQLLESLRSPNDAAATSSKPARKPSRQGEAVDAEARGGAEGAAGPEAGFQELGLSAELIGAVRELGLGAPTEIQRLAIPGALSGRDVVVASHTGSGKTLAYLLPVVQMMREDEAEGGRSDRLKRPRAIVLCPTRELAEQVLRVAKSLCHHARFRAAMLSGGASIAGQQQQLQSWPVDLLIATPGRLLQHMAASSLSLSLVKYLVLDEADTMFDAGFGADIRRLLRPLRNRGDAAPGGAAAQRTFQTVLVTATITKVPCHRSPCTACLRLSVLLPPPSLLSSCAPSLTLLPVRHAASMPLTPVAAPATHTAAASTRFIHCMFRSPGVLSHAPHHLPRPYLALSPTALLPCFPSSGKQLLQPLVAGGHRCMVFCNTVQSCRAVDHFLSDANILTTNYHGQVPPQHRCAAPRRAALHTPCHAPILCCSLVRAVCVHSTCALFGSPACLPAMPFHINILHPLTRSPPHSLASVGGHRAGNLEAFRSGGAMGGEDDLGIAPMLPDRFHDSDSDGEWDDDYEAAAAAVPRSKQRAVQPVLVCTDLAARGLDLVVDHVINFDFPMTPVPPPPSHSSHSPHFPPLSPLLTCMLHLPSLSVSRAPESCRMCDLISPRYDYPTPAVVVRGRVGGGEGVGGVGGHGGDDGGWALTYHK
ncbi:unnamed protein product [Closterium sp. NIES-53]